jgi:type IV secretion system protein VirB3
MSNIYPEKATLFLALTRPAMILGVSVEYMFFCLSTTLALVILMNRLGFFLIGVVFYVLGRIIFYWDCHLIAIIMKRLPQQQKQLSRILGQAYYEVG